MTKKTTLLLVYCIILVQSYAQQPDQLLNQRAAQNPVEKVYIHLDRTDYIAGQTIWFKAYTYSDFLPAVKSSDLFVELLNASGTVINRQVLPLFGGFTRGQMELPDILASEQYLIRAYTATTLNHDPDFLYKKNVFIFSKNKRVASIVAVPALRLEFFPEGGNLISGLSNSIAFKASDENGLPVSSSGIIKNEKGEKVAELSSYHDGMGYFDLTAEEGNQYYAVLNGDATGKKYYLPAQTTKGVVSGLSAVGSQNRLRYCNEVMIPYSKHLI